MQILIIIPGESVGQIFPELHEGKQNSPKTARTGAGFGLESR
jgi:hypothetical protein